MTDAVSSICALGATLGEGPVWCARENMLWCVDIKQRLVHRFDPHAGALRSWPAPAQPGWIVPAASGGFVVGLQSGLHHFDPADGGFTLLVAPESGLPGNHLTDATVAGDGTTWFGSMDDAERAVTGHLYRYSAKTMTRTTVDPDGTLGLRTAFATTARQSLDAAALRSQPLAGNLLLSLPAPPG